MSHIRDMLFNLSQAEVILTVFFASCVVGSAFTLICVAVRATPDTLRDLRAWRLLRKTTMEGHTAWIDGHAPLKRTRD